MSPTAASWPIQPADDVCMLGSWNVQHNLQAAPLKSLLPQQLFTMSVTLGSGGSLSLLPSRGNIDLRAS